MKKQLLIIAITISALSACTSRQMVNTSCDFATGTAGSYIDRKIDNGDDSGNDANGSMEQDILAGVLTIFTGAINRATASNKKDKDCP